MNSPSLFTLSLLLAGAGLAAAQNGNLLPPTYQTGKTYVLQSTYHGETDLGIGLPAKGDPKGKPADTKQVIQMQTVMTATCSKNPDEAGTRLIKSTIDSAKMDLKMGGMIMKYDSKEKDSEATLLGQTLSKLIGKTFSFTLNDKDQIIRIEGLDQLPGAAGGLNPFGPEQVKQMTLPGMSLGIPAEGVQKGQTWTEDSAVNIGQFGKVTVKQNLLYVRDENVDGHPCAVLQNDAALDLNVAAQNKPGGMNIRAENGAMTGQILLDKELRFPREGQSKISMTIVMPNPLDQAQTIKAPVLNQVTFKLLSVTDS